MAQDNGTKTAVAARKAPAPKVPEMQAHRAKQAFAQLRAALVGAFKERDSVIDALLAALVAGEHIVMLGAPGSGKSAIARALCGAFSDAAYFETLITRYSEPSDIFGGVDLPKWTNTGVYERRSAGMLQEADIAFLTEVFKGNTSILNSLLTAMNERLYFDGGQRHKMPLRTLIGDSNEMPESAELAAMWDRFLLRVQVDYVREQAAFEAVLAGSDPSVCTLGLGLSLKDLEQAQREARALPLGPDVLGALYSLRAALGTEGIVASDRRWKQLVGLLRAWAWLQGEAAVDTLHFEILKHGLWTDPREIAKVASTVTKVASPVLNEATEAFDAIMEQVNALPAGGSIKTQGAAVAAELKKAIANLDAIKNKSSSNAVTARIAPMQATLKEKHTDLVTRITAELGL